jgi:hypothetical protein
VNTLTRRAAGVSAIIGVVLAAGSVAANAAGRLVIGDGSGNRTVTATGNTTINAPSNLCANPVDASAVCDNDQDDVSAGSTGLGGAPDGPVVGTGSGNLDQTVLGNTSTHTPFNTCGNPVSAVDQEPPAEPPAPATAQVASGQAAELNGEVAPRQTAEDEDDPLGGLLTGPRTVCRNSQRGLSVNGVPGGGDSDG